MSPNVETQFKDWLNASLSSLNASLPTRMQKVVEIGGEIPGPDHGLSIALQVDFPDKDAADNWEDSNLHNIAGAFMAQFGPSAAYFTTLLEAVTLI